MRVLFVGGSRHISRLNSDIKRWLVEELRDAPQVVVGDANGADKALQAFLRDQRYPHVTVFSTLDTPRNNLNHWPVQHVSPPHKKRDFAFFAAKDDEMARRADLALMLWDGESRGTIVNVARVLDAGKVATVFVSPCRELRVLKKFTDLEALLVACSHKSRDQIASYLTQQRSLTEQRSLF